MAGIRASACKVFEFEPHTADTVRLRDVALKNKNKREMSAYELTFPQVPKRMANGGFVKGYTPHNKGKKALH